MSQNAPLVKIAEKALEKAATGIARDHFEIENLQGSSTLEKFVMVAMDKMQSNLMEGLQGQRQDCGLYVYDDKHPTFSNPQKFDYIWNVLPLDSKMNLLRGSKDFFNAIAVEKYEGETHQTVAAVVSNPVMQEIFRAEVGNGSFANSRRLRVSNRNRLITALVEVNGAVDKTGKGLNFFPGVAEILAKSGSFRCRGSAFLSMLNVAAGKADLGIIALKSSVASVKYAAGILLIKEAGGFVRELTPSDGGTAFMLFGNGSLYDEALRILEKYSSI